ncbi:MAG TPA: hypothetical protein VE033_15125 [Acetobacteraceae bacterium]|nr:hypothetical protein [Acetobacteraceae bacterium]
MAFFATLRPATPDGNELPDSKGKNGQQREAELPVHEDFPVHGRIPERGCSLPEHALAELVSGRYAAL